MKAEVLFATFDTAALLDRFGKKIPGAGLLGKTLLKHPKKLGDLALPLTKKFIKDYGFDMELNSISVNAEDAAVKSVSVEVSRINYAQVGAAALPLAKRFLRRDVTAEDVNGLLEKIDLPDSDALAKVKAAVEGKTDVAELIRAAAAALNDDETRALANALLGAYQEKLCEKGNCLLQKKRLSATISSVTLN